MTVSCLAGRNKLFVKIVLFFTVLAGACARYGSFVPPQVPLPEANYVGSEECAVCHEDVFQYYQKTVHYKVRYFEVAGQERGCEGCHGPGSVHIAEKGKGSQIIGTIENSVAQDKAFICERKLGKGKIVIMGSLP